MESTLWKATSQTMEPALSPVLQVHLPSFNLSCNRELRLPFLEAKIKIFRLDNGSLVFEDGYSPIPAQVIILKAAVCHFRYQGTTLDLKLLVTELLCMGVGNPVWNVKEGSPSLGTLYLADTNIESGPFPLKDNIVKPDDLRTAPNQIQQIPNFFPIEAPSRKLEPIHIPSQKQKRINSTASGNTSRRMLPAPMSMQHSISSFPLSIGSSVSSFTTARSSTTTRSVYGTPVSSGFNSLNIGTIYEEKTATSMLGALAKLGTDYQSELRAKNLMQPLDKELNWSGKGQHVPYAPNEELPLKFMSHLGASVSATVDKVLCKRIALARKTMRCTRKWSISDALQEVCHLQNLRHFHIIQLVGTYLQGRNFSILMYPVADCDLGTFLEDTADMNDIVTVELETRKKFLASSLGCLLSAIQFVHENTTKHMDIKPQNILVRKTSDSVDPSYPIRQPRHWRVYLADFGLSRSFAAQDHSQTDGPTSRTPKYCAPEVYQYESRGRSSDIFSLGCVFAEILTTYDGFHPQEFADFRCGDDSDESFHKNLDRVTEWVQKKLRISYLLRTRVLLPMLSLDPKERPTASILWQHLLTTDVQSIPIDFQPYDYQHTPCCSREPEPYEVYEDAPVDSPMLEGETSLPPPSR
jgi:serine/threonine protein kinase